ncbi:MAG: FadR/GntR family transcriptional regulator [Lachnospiraceae bacterium]
MSKINKQSLAEKTADTILNMIYCENYAVGSKLPGEYELADKLEVGRNTLRQAIRILVDRNILEVQRGSGTFVSQRMGLGDDPLGLSHTYDRRKMVEDLIQLRILIEPKMAALAAQNATAGESSRLLEICEEMEILFQHQESYLLKDLEFHALVAAASRNLVVSSIIPSIHQALLLQRTISKDLLGEKTLELHHNIAKAIKEHRSSDAYDYMLAHLMQNNERIR